MFSDLSVSAQIHIQKMTPVVVVVVVVVACMAWFVQEIMLQNSRDLRLLTKVTKQS